MSEYYFKPMNFGVGTHYLTYYYYSLKGTYMLTHPYRSIFHILKSKDKNIKKKQTAKSMACIGEMHME